MKYNKLVRDKIPQITREKGQIPLTHIAEDSEYFNKLKEKLREEVEEYLEKENHEELADILEVVHAICDHKKISIHELESLRKKKAEERGAFKDKIILEETK